AARCVSDIPGSLLRAARVPVLSVQRRDAAGAFADAGCRRLSAVPPDQLRRGCDRAWPRRRKFAPVSRACLDQGLSRPDRAWNARPAPEASVRIDARAILRVR